MTTDTPISPSNPRVSYEDACKQLGAVCLLQPRRKDPHLDAAMKFLMSAPRLNDPATLAEFDRLMSLRQQSVNSNEV